MDLHQRRHLIHGQFLPKKKQSARASIEDDMSWGRPVWVVLRDFLLSNICPFYTYETLCEIFLYRNCWRILFELREEGITSFTKFGAYSPRLWISRKYLYFSNRIKGRRTDGLWMLYPLSYKYSLLFRLSDCDITCEFSTLLTTIVSNKSVLLFCYQRLRISKSTHYQADDA